MSRLKEGPPVCVLQVEGTNCDRETADAFKKAEGNPCIVHLNEIKKREQRLGDYKILALPGGFAHGDYGNGAGRILGLYLTEYLKDQILEFREKGGLVLGICNGFQVLVRTGLLPFGKMGDVEVTLDKNNVGHFRCSWVHLKVEKKNPCVFLDGLDPMVYYQVAHGEGKFYTPPERPEVLQRIENESLVVFRYADALGNPAQEYPKNPNSSVNAIAGICDPSGKILGLMPHPERAVEETQYPNWRRQRILGRPIQPQGLPLFQKMVSYAAQM